MSSPKKRVLISTLVPDPKQADAKIPMLVYYSNGAVVHRGSTLVRFVYVEGALLEKLLDTVTEYVKELEA